MERLASLPELRPGLTLDRELSNTDFLIKYEYTLKVSLTLIDDPWNEMLGYSLAEPLFELDDGFLL